MTKTSAATILVAAALVAAAGWPAGDGGESAERLPTSRRTPTIDRRRIVPPPWAKLVVSSEYIMVDLVSDAWGDKYNVVELLSTPEDLATNGDYKTTKLLLRRIPAGSFFMGSPLAEAGRRGDELPHDVRVAESFYLGVYETTQEQYRLVMGFNVSRFAGSANPVESVSWQEARGGSWPGGPATAESFIGKLSARTGMDFDLPTEEQWEYACRAGVDGPYNGGSYVTLGDLAWYQNNSESVTHAVGLKRPNAWGLYDMHGNVGEWCLNGRGDYSRQEAAVSDGGGMVRVRRGGCWGDAAAGCRAAARDWAFPGERSGATGFRVAMRSCWP